MMMCNLCISVCVFVVYIHTTILSTGRLSQTKTRQRRELIEGPYVFDRSNGEYDQESRRLRRVSRHRHSKGIDKNIINLCTFSRGICL